jgi:hypothetical protein
VDKIELQAFRFDDCVVEATLQHPYQGVLARLVASLRIAPRFSRRNLPVRSNSELAGRIQNKSPAAVFFLGRSRVVFRLDLAVVVTHEI